VGTTVDPQGAREWFGFVDLHAQGTDPVHIESARLVDLPSGLKLDGIHAVSYQESNRPGNTVGYIGSMSQADVDKRYPGLRLHPLSAIVLRSGVKSAWYIVIVLEPERYGEFKTTGMELNYSAGDSHGSQVYAFRIDVHCGPPQITSSPSPSVP
jgi:hypothetical protein